MWNGTYKQRIWPKLPYVTIAPFYTSGECTTKVSHLEVMPGKCHGSYLLPHMLMVGLHMELI